MSNKSKKNESLNNFKNEIASELGVNLESENITAKEAGSVGGEMVKRMVEKYEKETK